MAERRPRTLDEFIDAQKGNDRHQDSSNQRQECGDALPQNRIRYCCDYCAIQDDGDGRALRGRVDRNMVTMGEWGYQLIACTSSTVVAA